MLFENCYILGSSFEGSTTNGLTSDKKFVLVNEVWPVVTNISEAKQYDKCVLLVQDSNTLPGPEVIKLFSCSTQLSMKFLLLINVKMLTIVGILTFMSRKNSILSLSQPEKCCIS